MYPLRSGRRGSGWWRGAPTAGPPSPDPPGRACRAPWSERSGPGGPAVGIRHTRALGPGLLVPGASRRTAVRLRSRGVSRQSRPVGGAPLSRAESQARTRRLLVETARAMFLRDGYAATSLERVADEAGFSK